ncbi:hypothetical protein PVAG01_03244 [Phlyctema vagabunda]|uniref:Uncharacterized protein n=1 Tax=Phlyctema vagabunda TaxID=108571 RepID=A0ABR4PSU0_9HELO
MISYIIRQSLSLTAYPRITAGGKLKVENSHQNQNDRILRDQMRMRVVEVGK